MHLLHRAGQCADELFAENMGKSDLTPRQFAVLKAVALANDPSQTMLVEMTGIDRSTLADIVARLVSRGLLQRRRTRLDARMYAVKLTDQGMEAIAAAEPAVNATDDRIMSVIPHSQRAEFIAVLEGIVDHLKVKGGAKTSSAA